LNLSRDTAPVTFEDLDATYYADSCEPLRAAADAGEVSLQALARGHYPGRPLAAGAVDGLRTLGFWDAAQDQSWGLGWHRNEGIELTYVAKGQVAFAVDERSWDLHAGHVTVTRPWQRHRVGNPHVQASNLQWLIIDVGVRRPNQVWKWPDWTALAPRDLERLTKLLQHNEHAVWVASPALGAAFAAASALVTEDGPGSESDLRIRISALLLELFRTLELENMQLDDSLTKPQRGVRLFLEDLHEHLSHRWTVTSMASSCSMGRTQFTRYCQELTNMAPVEYLSHLRIKRAKALLESSDLSITDVAMLCGFETPQYFATRFRAIAGLPPARYREMTTNHNEGVFHLAGHQPASVGGGREAANRSE